MSTPISSSQSTAPFPSATTQTQYPVKRWSHEPGSGWHTDGVDGMDCESLLAYENGGLCPIILGDVLSGVDILQKEEGGKDEVCSFKVLGKLGYGSYSTVWLGREVNSNNEDRHLVFKVLRHEHSSLDNTELRILRKLKGRLHVAFFYMPSGENQLQYLCLGLEPLGATPFDFGNLDYSPFGNVRAIPEFIRTFIKRVMELHRVGICHGNISYSNVAFGVQRDEAFKPDALERTFVYIYKSFVKFLGPEDPQPSRPPHLPEYILQCPGEALETDREDMSKFDLLDFGSAFEGPSSENVKGTSIFLPPEVEPETEAPQFYTAKSDLWSVGCVIVSTLTNSYHLFNPNTRENYINATKGEQLDTIHHALCVNGFLKRHQAHCWVIARIVHSLVQVDPTLRDANAALKLLDDLEAEVEKEELMAEAQGTTD